MSFLKWASVALANLFHKAKIFNPVLSNICIVDTSQPWGYLAEHPIASVDLSVTPTTLFHRGFSCGFCTPPEVGSVQRKNKSKVKNLLRGAFGKDVGRCLVEESELCMLSSCLQRQDFSSTCVLSHFTYTLFLSHSSVSIPKSRPITNLGSGQTGIGGRPLWFWNPSLSPAPCCLPGLALCIPEALLNCL